MSKKGLLIATVLIFLLIATAMALENKNASENFSNQEYLNEKSIENASSKMSIAEDTAAGNYGLQNGSRSVGNYLFSI